MKETKEIFWTIGLFEGEGCITISKVKGRIKKDGTRTKLEPYKYSHLTISSTDYDTLLKFNKIVNYGKIYKLKKPTSANKILWQWSSCLQQKNLEFIFLIYPYLSKRRQKRSKEVFGNIFNIRKK